MMRLGVSACLLGDICRYNGASAKDDFVTQSLSNYFELVGYCPEATVFGTPREAIRLVEYDKTIKVMTVNSKIEVTDELLKISKIYADEIKRQDLCGFVLKSKSPSCGMDRVKLYQSDSYMCEKKEMGIFAKVIKEANPYLPLEEEGRLVDAWLRENFVMQIFAYEDLRNFLASRPSMHDLVEFHTTYKYLIYAKSQKSYQVLGRIVANQINEPMEEILQRYKEEFSKAIAQKSSISKSYNILLHIFGYFKNDLNSVEKEELLGVFEEFKAKIIPLIVPIKMLQLYVHKFNQSYLAKQKFLNPYPNELKLRSSLESGK